MSRVPIRLPAKHGRIRAVRTTADGITFASKHEAKVYSDLKLLARAGEITEFIWDKKLLRFPIMINGIHVCYYEADFSFLDQQGKRVIVDAKGMKTEIYKLKKKLFEADSGMKITEM